MRADTSQGIECMSFYGVRTMITRNTGDKRSTTHSKTKDPDFLYEDQKQNAKRPKVEKNGKRGKKTTAESEHRKKDGDDFDAVRQKNIAEKMAFLQSLNIDGLKQGLGAKKRGRPTNAKKKPKVEEAPLPQRQSLRLQNKQPSTEAERILRQDDKAEVAPKVERIGHLDFKDVLESYTDEESFLIDESTRNTLKMTLPCLTTNVRELERCSRAFKNMTTDDTCVEKLTERRITSLVLHPSKEVTLACAGDKTGYLGFFKLGKGGEPNMVETYSPHADAVMCLNINRDAPEYVYSSSYDETIRRANIDIGIFEEVYRAPPGCGVLYFAWDGPSTMTVSYSDGCVSFVDTRAAGDPVTRYLVHDKRIRTVDVHPVQCQYFVTASTDRTAKIWDRRKMSKKNSEPIAVLECNRSCTSAFFSPLTGERIVTTSMDNTLRIFDSSNLAGEITMSKCIRHLNETGRWLTPFRSTWVPQSDSVFLVGSLQQPRRIEAYTSHGSLLHKFTGESLGSVCSVLDMHPEQYILAGGNSSGRVFIFKEM